MSILTFGIPANVVAALTASTGVSLVPISMADAYYGVTPSHIEVTASSNVFLSFRISDTEGAWFTLTGMTVDISVNGIPMSSENYSTYAVGSSWNRIGVYDTNSYLMGSMDQGEILVGCGSRDSFAPYYTSINPGDTYRWDFSYEAQGQDTVHSVGTVTYVPEPTSLLLVGVSTLCFLRRKRV